MLRICLVEDEEKVASFIRNGLEEHYYLVDHAKNASRALAMMGQQYYDLMILDVMLPDTNGVELCTQIRQTNPTIPILMLTALGTIGDKVSGLKSGADDYMVKPFHFEELLARIEALIRRREQAPATAKFLAFGDLKLDTWGKTAERAGKKIQLTAKEYDLLELFLSHPRKLLSRQFIAEKVWGIGFDTGTNVIDVYVNYLRNKVDKDFEAKLIHTIIGMGYILKQE
ncbi:response regulator transcription factor [Solitalea canadensis]|uniref:Response regulator with CheY-like receiver domain and winged-helix DNA-binding domain n=1 Tax=Solitalea canadensis (strain ATCC 29591 / DSM 3403 / JCM 21819 / LMG 8368 / NBRC 15130 / NCIMB 12057 / USAM 9D) TaxID=929556 RepID=H8KN49_SOLCM|nr:response regulator transcription factor [Solitalea canadensis]AFD09382.1 response regulator with CheY-like receiver domain and winged-helix DNA-binding domain [Solitalea canadensis DSM 3403]